MYLNFFILIVLFSLSQSCDMTTTTNPDHSSMTIYIHNGDNGNQGSCEFNDILPGTITDFVVSAATSPEDWEWSYSGNSVNVTSNKCANCEFEGEVFYEE